MKNELLTVEDGKLIKSQLTAALGLVTGLRSYLETVGKLQSAEIRQFKAAETALQAIKVKPTISRASEMAKRMSQVKPEKF